MKNIISQFYLSGRVLFLRVLELIRKPRNQVHCTREVVGRSSQVDSFPNSEVSLI